MPAQNEILVANGNDGSLKIVGSNDYALRRSIPGFDDADNLRLDPGSGHVWLGYGDGALAEIDPQTLKVIRRLKLKAHPESFQLDLSGGLIFVNVPDAKDISVFDRKEGRASSWPMRTFQANFPMALNAGEHRLFVGARNPARLVIFDSEKGTQVSDLETSGDTDDLFYDPARKRIYISCGEGFLDTVQEESPNVYRRTARIPTASGARTSFFSPTLNRLYLAVPERGQQKAEIRVFEAVVK